MSDYTVYTIGHSNISFDKFSTLLQTHDITAIADVRSTPYSKFTPHFNREALQKSLRAIGIAYVFVGKELGARSEDATCYNDNGQVIYSKLQQTTLFQDGIERVINGAQKFRLALVCAEKEPFTCHRSILIGQALATKDVDVRHILHDGRVETHEQMLQRLIAYTHKQRTPAPAEMKDMFSSGTDVDKSKQREQALQMIEQQIAYVNPVFNKYQEEHIP
jgi:uncharacterized protein (DUF488 family)